MERKTAAWLFTLVKTVAYCSHCGFYIDGKNVPFYYYCPNCGRKMNYIKDETK